MLKKSLFVVLALVGVVVAWAPTASAATTAECQAKISDLRTATQAATFTGQNAPKDEAGLIGKLDAASQDLAAEKNADAIQKLTDFRTKVVQLRDQGKLAATDADRLLAGADDAIACIQSVST